MMPLNIKIAGVFQYPEGKPALKALQLGDQVILEREPTNQYDSNAIAIFAMHEEKKIKLGYVPKTTAEYLKNCTDISATKAAAWDMITITCDKEKTV